jgi:3-oxoacyl-[acyl-carrier-protein] synthase II
MKPFDARRDGFVCSEGSAVMALERLDRALDRGAHIYAEVLGYAANTDAYHVAIPDPEGAGAVRCMRRALENAGIPPSEVDYINAHGPATEVGDAAESKAIKTVFGEHAYRVPVNSTKSMVGHASGGAGAIEAMACAKTIETGTIHPTINYEVPDPECDLDYVPNQARQAERADHAVQLLRAGRAKRLPGVQAIRGIGIEDSGRYQKTRDLEIGICDLSSMRKRSPAAPAWARLRRS